MNREVDPKPNFKLESELIPVSFGNHAIRPKCLDVWAAFSSSILFVIFKYIFRCDSTPLPPLHLEVDLFKCLKLIGFCSTFLFLRITFLPICIQNIHMYIICSLSKVQLSWQWKTRNANIFSCISFGRFGWLTKQFVLAFFLVNHKLLTLLQQAFLAINFCRGEVFN